MLICICFGRNSILNTCNFDFFLIIFGLEWAKSQVLDGGALLLGVLADGGSWLLAGLDAVYQVVHGASPLPSRLRLAAELLVANRIRPPRTLTALGIDKLCQICNFIRYISTWKKFLILVTSWSDRDALWSFRSLPLETWEKENKTSNRYFCLV